MGLSAFNRLRERREAELRELAEQEKPKPDTVSEQVEKPKSKRRNDLNVR